MSIQVRVLCGALCVALLLPLSLAAQTLLKPLPKPDTGKLAPAQAQQLSADRAEFEKVRTTLVGPPLAQAYADMGVLYARAGFKDVAALAFYDASQVDPNDARWFYLRGLLAREARQNAEARADFEAALALDKVYLPIAYRLSDTLVDSGDLAAARRLLETTARAHPDQAVAHAMLGQLSLREKRYTDAVENLLAALKLEPQATQLYEPLAAAYAGVGNTQGAKDAQAKVGAVPPRLPDPLALGLYGAAAGGGDALQQAQQLANAGKLAAARDKLAEALSARPDDVDALAFQARLEASLGDTLVAEAAVEQARKTAPDNANVLLARAVVYEYAGNEDQAYAFYQRAARADAKLTKAHLLLGNAEMRRGRYAAAAEQYRQAVALEPDIKARAYLVAAQVAAGQCAQALSDLGAAQERDPRNGDLMQLFVRLASTCPATKPEARDMALDYAQTLYKQRPDAGDSSALALALAAHGKFKEAQQYQAEAIFEAVRARDSTSAELYRSTQASFAAGRMPDRPWPAAHPYFKPPLLKPIRAAAGTGKKPAQ